MVLIDRETFFFWQHRETLFVCAQYVRISFGRCFKEQQRASHVYTHSTSIVFPESIEIENKNVYRYASQTLTCDSRGFATPRDRHAGTGAAATSPEAG
jgi:hypothetical protein